MLDQIWQKQKELMEKFDEIEAANGMLQVPLDSILDLDNPFWQMRIRDFAWRITEEITEASESLRFQSAQDYREEIADVYSFLVELYIMLNIPPDELLINPNNPTKKLDVVSYFNYMKSTVAFDQKLLPRNKEGRIRDYMYDMIEMLGRAMNLLKKKSWKKDVHITLGRSTRIDEFYEFMYLVHMAFVKILVASDIYAQDLVEIYNRKFEINQVRIKDE